MAFGEISSRELAEVRVRVWRRAVRLAGNPAGVGPSGSQRAASAMGTRAGMRAGHTGGASKERRGVCWVCATATCMR